MGMKKRELDQTAIDEAVQEAEDLLAEITDNPDITEEELADIEDKIDGLLEDLQDDAPSEDDPAADTATEGRKARRASVERRIAGIKSGLEKRQTGVARREVKPEGRGGGESERRGRNLMQNRSVTVGSGTIVLPKHYGSDIRPTFNDISSLIDAVNINVLPGGDSYTQPFEVGYGMAGYSLEGEDYNEVDPVVNYIEINRSKVTAYAEDTEEVLKLPHADYDALVMRSVRNSMRKLLAKEILVGTGDVNRLCGIYNAPEKVIPADSDIELGPIDEHTLDEIIFGYGGDEDVEGFAALIINKNDLKAFSAVRDINKQRVYDIEIFGNTGTINKIPFIINSSAGALSNPDTGEGAYCMVYGPLQNYMLTVFSDVEVKRSDDYKFRKGIIAHRGSGFFGGNVVSYKGFLRIKKKSA